jgi:hypothetical protein
MRLDEYVWSRNPRGLHVSRILVTPLEHSRYVKMQAGWVKLVAVGDEYVDDAGIFMSMGMTPVVRIYRERPGVKPFTPDLRDTFMWYLNAGVKWFEYQNEPNLPIEWPVGTNITYQNFDGIIRPLMDNWLQWAEFIISMGGYPGFPALADTNDATASTLYWMDAFLGYLQRSHFDRFKAILANGAWCATHPYILNHFYQTWPGRPITEARPPEAVNAREPGWHFEYPYDPICQMTDPGRTVYGSAAKEPHGDPVGLTASGRLFNERCASIWGTQAVPVLGTEGGIWPIPEIYGNPWFYQQDNRYPMYTTFSQSEGTVAMYEWIATSAPEWFFGVCLWKEDEYYTPYAIRAIERMAETPVILKNVPPTEVFSENGPGSVSGEPTYHMVILAPGLPPEWFYETAQAYWNLYRPIVTNTWSMIDFIPRVQSLACTIIATPDVAQGMVETLRGRYPNVFIDLVLARGNLQDVADVFNSRVFASRRFG